MKVLVIGSGGREHALAWKIAQSDLLTKLYVSPGNPGTAAFAHNINIGVNGGWIYSVPYGGDGPLAFLDENTMSLWYLFQGSDTVVRFVLTANISYSVKITL